MERRLLVNPLVFAAVFLLAVTLLASHFGGTSVGSQCGLRAGTKVRPDGICVVNGKPRPVDKLAPR